MTGIYIHIPFCERKCLYCDFNSYADKFHLENAYVDALLEEIKHYKGTTADTLYIGGGTPSALSVENIKRLLSGCKENFHLTQDAEITMEVNPASSMKEKLEAIFFGGVNRLSIGIQSFSNKELTALGRLHSREEAINTVRLAKEIGFGNISIDLMLAIPHQTKNSLKENLEEAVALNPEHISAYSLILEPGTPFYEKVSDLPDEESEREFYWYTVEFLEKHGYHQYEISNFSKEGKESRHNRKYWSGEDYLGIGAGAHSFANKLRYSHKMAIGDYIKNPLFKENIEYINEQEFLKERFLLGLRKKEGIRYFGEFPKEVDRLKKDGLLEEKDGFLRLTKKGTDLANQVFMEFI